MFSTEIISSGYRLRLHFDSYSDTYDFWVNADSDSIFPCGWCEKNGQKLRPPKNYELSTATQASTSPIPSQTSQGNRIFSWPQYLKFTSSVAAPRHLFFVANQTEVPVYISLKILLHEFRVYFFFSISQQRKYEERQSHP